VLRKCTRVKGWHPCETFLVALFNPNRNSGMTLKKMGGDHNICIIYYRISNHVYGVPCLPHDIWKYFQFGSFIMNCIKCFTNGKHICKSVIDTKFFNNLQQQTKEAMKLGNASFMISKNFNVMRERCHDNLQGYAQ
jgi:hypothetical protein